MSDRQPVQHVFFTLPDRPPSLVDYHFADATLKASFLLSAVAAFGRLQRPGFALRFHLIATAEITATDVGTLVSELAEALSLDRGELYEEIWTRRILLEASDASEKAHTLIPYMLREVSEGDCIFVEPTQGMRPIQMALTVGVSLVSSLMNVETSPLYYSENASPRPGYRIAEVRNILSGIHQTMAVRDLLHHLRPEALAAGAGGRLDRMADALDGGNTRLLCEALPGLTPDEGASPEVNPVVAWALRRFRSYFPDEGLSDRDADTAPNDFLLDVELDLVERLRLAGRHGDALRVLREHVVNMTTLAILPERRLDAFSLAARHLFERHGLQAKSSRERSTASAARFFFLLSEQRNLFTHGAFKGSAPSEGARLKDAMRGGSFEAGASSDPTLSGAAERAWRFLRAEVDGGRGDAWLTQEQLDALLVLLPALLRQDRARLSDFWRSRWGLPARRGLIAVQLNGQGTPCGVAGGRPEEAAAAARQFEGLDASKWKDWKDEKMHLEFATWTLIVRDGHQRMPAGWQWLPGSVDAFDVPSHTIARMKGEGS